MNLEMEGGTEALAAAAEAAPPRELERQPYDDTDIAVIRALQGPMAVDRPPLRRRRRRGRDVHRRAPRPPRAGWWSARSCAGSPRSSSTAAPASRPTAWASGGCPRSRSRRSARRMAAVRGISHCYQRPTYADWPYSVFTMAHGRSKEECDAILDGIADEHDLHGDDRAVLYSSTEFKKIRLHYFTDDYAALGGGALIEPLRRSSYRASALGGSMPGRGQLAGAGDALDRARPDLHRARRGLRRLRRRRQPLRRLGLLLGPADPRPRRPARSSRRSARPPAAGRATARRPRARSSSPTEVAEPLRLGRDGADDQLGDRGDDERDPARPRGDRPRARSSSSPAPTTATSTGCSPRPARGWRPPAIPASPGVTEAQAAGRP